MSGVSFKSVPGDTLATTRKDGKSSIRYENLRGRGTEHALRGSTAFHPSSSLFAQETTPDASSEKEQGNEYFRNKKYVEAIDCYSRSIAFSPTAVAYANRAMAYIKIKRFEEAEADCTEALNLDDRYVKAYSRRATARKELGKIRESFEDSEFALVLEPNNQELRKQYAEAKTLYGKEVVKKTSSILRNSIQGDAEVRGSKFEDKQPFQVPNNVPSKFEEPFSSAFQSNHIQEINLKEENKSSVFIKQLPSQPDALGERRMINQSGSEIKDFSIDSSKKIHTNDKKLGHKSSLQEILSRAAIQTTTVDLKSIKIPKTAYEFEVLWRRLSNDPALQVSLVKSLQPTDLSQLFKNALSRHMLFGIIKCTSDFLKEDTELAVKMLDNLTRVPRFDMIIMCLTSAEKSDIEKIWGEMLCTEGIPTHEAEVLKKLRFKYCPR